MKVKSKSKILFAAIICLFYFQLFSEQTVAMDDMSSQRKIEAQTVQTMSTQPAESKSDDVLAFPGLVLKLSPGFGCAENVDESSCETPGPAPYFLYSRDIATHLAFEIKEICFGNPKGPDIKRDFIWFKIVDKPINNPKVGYNIPPPGLVLSLFPNRHSNVVSPSHSGAVRYPKDGVVIKKRDNRFHWLETTGRCFVDWSLIKKLPKFTIVGLKNHRTQKNESFKWKEKVYDCADLEKHAPPGFKRVGLRDYCWFEKTTGPDILPESL